MDLRYSAADEAFRKEVRAFLDDAVASYGPPPPPGDWDARRAYDTGWQRLLHDGGYAGLNWPVEYGGRGLPASQQPSYHKADRTAVGSGKRGSVRVAFGGSCLTKKKKDNRPT